MNISTPFLLSSWSFCKNFFWEHFLDRKFLRLSVKPPKERSITVRRYFVSKSRLCLSPNHKSCKCIPWNTFNALDSPQQPSSQLIVIADILAIVNVISANATCYLKFDRVGLLPSAWLWLNWMTHSLIFYRVYCNFHLLFHSRHIWIYAAHTYFI